MRLAIISDTHLGFGWGTERQEDSFLQAEEAVDIAIAQQCDAVLMPGDIFDSSVPKPEVLERALRIFSKFKQVSYDPAVLLNKTYSGVPVIAIHGTHELRSSAYKNPVQILEAGRFLVHLHLNHICLEKNGEKVCIYGMSGVPERFSKNILEQWSPQPEYNAKNIIMFHQNVSDFLPDVDSADCPLSTADLPPGFDLYIDGHLHWTRQITLNAGSIFLLAGSTIITQMKKNEADHPKGIHIYDTKTRTLTFIPLKNQRKLFYKRFIFDSATLSDIANRVDAYLKSILNTSFNKKPLVRLRLQGTLAKGFRPSDLDVDALIADYKDKAIFSISKEVYSETLKQRLLDIRAEHSNKPSVDELGQKLLFSNLSAMNFGEDLDAKLLFELLSSGDVDKALDYVLSKAAPNDSDAT